MKIIIKKIKIKICSIGKNKKNKIKVILQVKKEKKSLLQHHSSKASILQCSASFTVQLSQPYMTAGKTVALTRRTFVGKVMSLLLNILSRLVITFLPRSKRLLISWLQSPSAVIPEPPKIKSDPVSTVSPSISHEVMFRSILFLSFIEPIFAWNVPLVSLIFLGSKITVDGDFSHEIKRCLILWRKTITNLDSVLKSRHCFAS